MDELRGKERRLMKRSDVPEAALLDRRAGSLFCRDVHLR